MHNLHFLKGTPNAFRFPEIRALDNIQCFHGFLKGSFVFFRPKIFDELHGFC